MTVLEVIQRSTEFLARKGVESPRLQVELLLAHVLKEPRLRLYLEFERRLTDGELEEVRQNVKRRGGREPLQHIVGSTSFCGLEIKVNRAALIPRPETEGLAEIAWEFLASRTTGEDGPVRALDLGTGSGCIALALAAHAPGAEIWAVDISGPALALARENAQVHGLAERVRFFEGDAFDALPPGARFDLIVSNPPYIPSGDIDALMPEVREHDPRLALDGGPDGLNALRVIASGAGQFLRPGGQLMCEFGDGQGNALRELFEAHDWPDVTLRKDLSGRPRIVVARREKS